MLACTYTYVDNTHVVYTEILNTEIQSKVYGKCFSGVQLVDWLVETMDEDKLTYVSKVWNCSVSHLASGAKISRDQACILAQGLMNAQVFAHLGSAADFTGGNP